LGAAVIGLCWTSSPRAAAESCLDVIHIEAPPNLAPRLRAELERGKLDEEPGLECADARVMLSSEHSGYRVELVRASGRIQRSAASVELAAVWVDSWLRSGFSAEPSNEPAPPVPKPAPAERVDSPPPAQKGAAAVGPRGSVQPLAFAALGEDGTFWIGPELGARLFLTRAVWVGPELGVSFSTNVTNANRRVLRGGAAGGARFPLTDALALYPGISAGVATGKASIATDNGTRTSDGGGLYAGAACDLALRVAGPVSLFGGVGGFAFLSDSAGSTTELDEQSGENTGEDATIPAPLPVFLGGARLGVSVSLDGAP
jgi:hypothetical protein